MTAEEQARLVATLAKRVEELRGQVAALQLEYRQAGNNLATTVADDLTVIREAREESQRITTILRGTELFGRYAQDADHHLKVANHWRAAAVVVLLLMPVVAVVLAVFVPLGAVPLTIALTPLLTLFIYASVESHNHRRREFDRRRIALRMSAIEAFTHQRRESGQESDRRTAEKLMDEFVRKHFIQPDLDSNDMSYLGPRRGPVTVRGRDDKRQAAP
ncbi:hypothetical protein [Lentzea nigeriaca]|uniref:hypothetical protein n=1 Tax=Lentzea nigeriaca TaxID=1128665 RepID=UPI00195E1247|nr:hypothetical protein [Lentzea nigeriaca]MBM7864413.1 hypothetical protein [Lentzea nigeriaca]